MSRIWDIIPPPRRPAPPKVRPSQKNRKSSSLFLFFLFVVIVISVVFYAGGSSKNFQVNGLATQNPSGLASAPADNQTEQVAIKLINGSGQIEPGERAKKLLTEEGFAIAKAENALNLYDQTIIYYDINAEKTAREISGLLKDFQVNLQKLTQKSNYDIIIVIGSAS